MDSSIWQSSCCQNKIAVTHTVQLGPKHSHPGEQLDHQKKNKPVWQAIPATPIVAASDDASIKQNKSLSEYLAHYCHSLRNLITVTTLQPEVSLLPENLLDTAEQRLLSITELDKMQRHIRLQTDITINGKPCELETLPDDTPLFYQFYCQNQKSSIDDESIRIFSNNCVIEKSRAAVILINNDLINETVAAQVRQLEQTFENVHAVDVSKLLTADSVAGMKITQDKSMEGQFYLEVDARACTLEDVYTKGRIRRYTRFHDVLDIFQFVAMYHCDKVCELAGIKTSSRGCIKIDWDMELTAPIGALKCIGGFSTFIKDRIGRINGPGGNNELSHTLLVENSLVAVARPHHPIMAESVVPFHVIFSQFTCAVSRSFNQPRITSNYDAKQLSITGDDAIESLKILCRLQEREQITGEIDPAQQLSIKFKTSSSWKQKIAFPLIGIKADQSRVRGISSWQDKTTIS